MSERAVKLADVWQQPADHLHQQLKRYCLGLTGDKWEAEDLVQETWSKVIQAGSTDHANLHALLKRVAKNRWVSQRRRAKVERQYLEQTKRSDASAHDADTLYIEQIFQALYRHLTPTQRAVFLMKDVYDYSLHEIALLLRTTQGAVKSALHRARGRLEDVQRSLEYDSLTSDEADDQLWASLAAAYLDGDAEQVVRLALHNELDTAVTLSIAHNAKRIQASSSFDLGSSPLTAA